MTVTKLNYHKITGIVCAMLFLLTQAGCIYESQTITGEVVDESGVGISNAAVRACYIGSGWSDGLVWGVPFCSEWVMTDDSGTYSIVFKGPKSMNLYARKDGWSQTEEFSAKVPRVVLIPHNVRAARDAAIRDLHEKEFLTRLAGESATGYYCRVIMKSTQKIVLEYKGKKIEIFQYLFKDNERNNTFFSMTGPYDEVSTLANEAVLKIDGEEMNRNFSIRSDVMACRSDIYFAETNPLYMFVEEGKQIEILIPSIHAGFDMEIWQ